MRGFGHVQRKNSGYTRQKMLKMEMPGRGYKTKTTEDLRGCGDGGHAEAWCDRRMLKIG